VRRLSSWLLRYYAVIDPCLSVHYSVRHKSEVYQNVYVKELDTIAQEL